MVFSWIKYGLAITFCALAGMLLVACNNDEPNFPVIDGDFDLDQIEDDIEESDQEENEVSRRLIDVIPFSRLEASDTKRDFFPWPVESQDAIATIRDDNPETSWKIPENSETTLTID